MRDCLVTVALHILSCTKPYGRRLMQQKYASETLQKPATLYFAPDGDKIPAAEVEYCTSVRRGGSRPALYLAYVNPDAVVVPKKDPYPPTVWSVMLNFVAGGFAMYAGSLQAMADFVGDNDGSKVTRQLQEIGSPGGQRVTALVPGQSPVVTSHRDRSEPSREMVPTFGADFGKEMDIRRAVDALSELDDQTLEDLGIPHRSRIEHVVRYCHDC
jgi:hypothetical protein